MDNKEAIKEIKKAKAVYCVINGKYSAIVKITKAEAIRTIKGHGATNFVIARVPSLNGLRISS